MSSRRPAQLPDAESVRLDEPGDRDNAGSLTLDSERAVRPEWLDSGSNQRCIESERRSVGAGHRTTAGVVIQRLVRPRQRHHAGEQAGQRPRGCDDIEAAVRGRAAWVVDVRARVARSWGSA
jgi:hypothetical protein